MNAEASKANFVGRRGTGKTAVTYFLTQREPKTSVVLLPQILSIIEDMIGQNHSGDVHQRPFKTLVNSIKRALLNEVVLAGWKTEPSLINRVSHQRSAEPE